jgi:uncharacterized Zn finger protein
MILAMSICPVCGSERLIPMSFPEDEATNEVRSQPVLKCAACGHLVYDNEIKDEAPRSGHSN